MRTTILDRLISVLAYFTFGIFSVIWLIFANVARKNISPYLMFNLYQAIFISVIFAVIGLIYGIAIDLMSIIPFVGKAIIAFDIFFNQTPLYFSFTISGFLVTLVVVYLSIMSLIGKKPYIPCISDVVNSNFGG